MQVLSDEQKTYIELHAAEILKEKSISKAQLATAMGVKPQNANKLLGTKNVATLSQMASFLNLPLEVLLYGKEEKKEDIHGVLYVDGKPNIVYNRKEVEDLLNKIQKED